MAHLNVRERRIEAKIAYVGPALSGKTTNFASLRRASGERSAALLSSDPTDVDELALAWQPADRTLFRDCDLHVRVVAQSGAMSDVALDATLADVDGVVLVVNADPSAQSSNRASFASLREALGRADRRDVPVVLQVNKADLPEALAAEEVVAALDASLPHVSASATRDEGVVETLDAALNAVLAAMQAEAKGEANMSTDDAATAQTLAGSGHPLLAALRNILRETATEHAVGLEARVSAHLTDTLAALSARVDASTEMVRAVDARMEASTRSTIHQLELLRDGLEARLASGASESAKADKARLDTLKSEIVLELTQAFEQRAREERTQRDRQHDVQRAEMSRLVEARGRADRIELAATFGPLKVAIDALTTRLDEMDTRHALSEVASLAAGTSEVATELLTRVDATKLALAGVSRRLQEIEAARREEASTSSDAIASWGASLTEGLSASSEKLSAVDTRIGDLVEELKKPKKGWFT